MNCSPKIGNRFGDHRSSLQTGTVNMDLRQTYVGAVCDRPSGIATNFHNRLCFLIMVVYKQIGPHFQAICPFVRV
jgi:hypothetical protein